MNWRQAIAAQNTEPAPMLVIEEPLAITPVRLVIMDTPRRLTWLLLALWILLEVRFAA